MAGRSDCEMVELFILAVFTINQPDQLSLQWYSLIIEKAKTNGLAMLSAKAHWTAKTSVNIQTGAIVWKSVISSNSQVQLKVRLHFACQEKDSFNLFQYALVDFAEWLVSETQNLWTVVPGHNKNDVCLTPAHFSFSFWGIFSFCA